MDAYQEALALYADFRIKRVQAQNQEFKEEEERYKVYTYRAFDSVVKEGQKKNKFMADIYSDMHQAYETEMKKRLQNERS